MMRLALEPDITVIGEAEDGAEAVTAATLLSPDILVMDYEMPRMDGIEATKALAALGSHSRVIMLSIHDTVAVKEAAAMAGVRAFVCKQEPSENLLAIIREVAASG